MMSTDENGRTMKRPKPLEMIVGIEYSKGGKPVFAQRTPDLTDPAWQPGGWLAELAKNPPSPSPEQLLVLGRPAKKVRR